MYQQPNQEIDCPITGPGTEGDRETNANAKIT